MSRTATPLSGADVLDELLTQLAAVPDVRAIAGAVGVDDKTVRNDLAGAEMSAPAEVTGKDGKRYPAKRPTIVAVPA